MRQTFGYLAGSISLTSTESCFFPSVIFIINKVHVTECAKLGWRQTTLFFWEWLDGCRWLSSRAEFNVSVNQLFHVVSESKTDWGRGEGRGKGGGIGRQIHELADNTLTLKLWCLCGPAVRVHHFRPDWWVLQAEPKMANQYSKSALVEGICPEKIPTHPEQIKVINVVDPFRSTGFAEW